MEEPLKGIIRIRELSAEKSELDKQINQLKGQLQNKVSLTEMKEDQHKTKLGIAGYIIIFVVLDYILGVIVDRVLYAVILMTSYFTFQETVSIVLRRGAFNIMAIQLIMGIPFAVIFTLFIRAVIKAKDKKKNNQNKQDNQNSTRANEEITKKNVDTDVSNRIILNQITVCERRQEAILNGLKSMAPWYPESYFTPEAVDFIINQLETGNANSINQAIVFYEVERG